MRAMWICKLYCNASSIRNKSLRLFENQKDLLSSINQESSRRNTLEVEKQLLKQLGTVLEKLLVIDQENEIMLKKLLSTANQNAKAQSASSQPAKFNMNQPFCPNSSKQLRQAPLAPGATQATATVAKQEAPAQVEATLQSKTTRDTVNISPLAARPKTNARNKLKAYSHLR